MNVHNFQLSNKFLDNAKEYVTKPVRAAKYQPGMESGFMVYYSNVKTKDRGMMTNEGIKFFDTEKDAWDFINRNEPQYVKENGLLVEVPVEYDPPKAVLHRKEDDAEKKQGIQFCFDGIYAFTSNETEQYDFFILEDNCWIIQNMDGSIRVWCPDSEETFFGEETEIVYEKSGQKKYKQVAV